MIKEQQLNGKTIVVVGDASDICIIQPLERRELALLQNELNKINQEAGETKYLFVGIVITDWNSELSPWQSAPAFGNKAFSGGAPTTLQYIQQQLLPYLQKKYSLKDGTRYLLGGYSLAALFALWAGTRTSVFTAIVAASPSVWFPEWDEYATHNPTNAHFVYLSMGDAEPIAKNPLMARTGINLKKLCVQLSGQLGEAYLLFEWNEGGHFKFPEIRTGKGFGKALKILLENKK